MKRFLFIFLFIYSFVYSQAEYPYDSNDKTLPYWIKEMYSSNPDPGKIELLYNKYYNENKFIKNKHTQYYKRWKRSLSRKINKPKLYSNNYNNKKLGLPEWECLGPFDFDRVAKTSSYAGGSAHIYTVEQSISNNNVLYAGGATCGLWKSINKGMYWTPLFDTELMINEVYSLEIDHQNSDIVYFSSGGDLYRTLDGGNSFELLYEIGFIKDIIMHPNNTNLVYVCADDNLYLLNVIDNTLEVLLSGDILEIEFHPNQNNIVYVVKRDGNQTIFFKSIDQGQNFEIYDNGWPSPLNGNEQRRTEIAVSPDFPDRIVALATGSANGGSGLYGIYVSDNQGESWEFRCCGNSPAGIPSAENQNLMGWDHEGLDDGGQYYYDLALAIDPNNADKIHVGGVNHWISDDGGYTFTCPSKWSWADDKENDKYVHADIHDIKYYNEDLWIACDGGIFYSDNQGESISQRMFGIAGTDFWGFGAGFSDGNVMIGGTYHNATLLKDNDTYIQGDSLLGTLENGGWVSICGGDNYRGFVNYGNGRQVYLDEWGSGGGYNLSGNRNIPLEGFTMSVLSNASYITGESSNLEFDPRCYNILYIGNGNILYKSFNNGYSSSPLFDFGESVAAIEVGWNNPSIIYVSTYASYWSTKNVWRSDDGGETFINITPTFPGVVDDDWIPYDITVNENDANIVWIARCPNDLGYDSYEGSKIYKSINGGENWINVTGSGLSGENITNIEYQRGSENGIYLGTRKNVYYKDDSLDNWTLYNNGLPASTYSTQLVPYYLESKLKNGTNRSAWEVDFYQQFPPSAQISANKLKINCNNNIIQFVDHSALSNSNPSWLWTFPGGSPSTSIEKNPIVEYYEEGLYSVSLTISDDFGTDSQTIIDLIEYTNDPISLQGYNCEGDCQENFISGTIIANDSYGDGWNGNNISILVNGEILNQYTLESGSYEEFELCIPLNTENNCVEVIVQEGGWPEEVSWTIIDVNGNLISEGESPFYSNLYNTCPVYGCTDQNAINFNEEANTDDGSCCLGEFYTVLLEDGYGDGWNGNNLVIDSYVVTLLDGSEGEEVICLANSENCINISTDVGGGWPEEISWSIFNSQNELILSGGMPYSGCFLEGCTDINACNYNIEATIDNGECEYPIENDDCDNINIISQEIANEYKITTDVLGRNINKLFKGHLYLQINKDGESKKIVIF